MKFDDRFPNGAVPRDCKLYGDLIREGVNYEDPCVWCGVLTRWHEVNYEAPVCSDDCLGEMDEGYGYVSAEGVA